MPAVPRRSGRSRPLVTNLLGSLMALMALATVAATTPSDAGVASIGAIDALPLWIDVAGPPRGGAPPQAVVLAADGVAWWVGPGGPLRLASGLLGEQLTRCGDAVVAVGPRSTVTRFTPAPELAVPSAAGVSANMLHRPLCLRDETHHVRRVPLGSTVAVDPEGELVLLDRDLRVVARSNGVRALPDAEPGSVFLGEATGWAVAVLADPTQRYRNGLLGDEVEAGSVVLLSLPTLGELARWRVPVPAVIEERRALPWRAGGAAGVHVVVSSDDTRARLVTLVFEPGDGAQQRVAGDLRPLAEGPPLETDGGWLHLIATPGARVYAQHQPHQAGPFVRYDVGPHLTGAHRIVASDLDLTTHVLGERNLDRAVWVAELAPGVDLLLAPRSDARALVWVRCDASGCRPIAVVELPSALATNLTTVVDDGAVVGVLAADQGGAVWWLPVPGSPER